MTRWLTGLCAALAAFSAAGAEPPVATPSSDASGIERAKEVAIVKQVAIEANGKEPRCRRHAPTGSRIAHRRCETREQTSGARDAEREQSRRDVEEMRMRQLMRDQARALGGAMRGRGDR